MIKIECDRSLAKELSGYFTFSVPNCQYTPAFKKRLWDGKIRLFNLYTQTIFAGLYDLVIKFAKDRGYAWEDNRIPYNAPNSTLIKQFIDDLPISVGGQAITPHSYQIEAVQHALNRSRALLVSPTGSGKSLMIYLISRWILDINPTGKILIIVPTTGLVAQMLADFRDYSKQDNWRADRNIHTVMGGREKTSTKRIIISTWQSIYNQPTEYFDDFIGVFGDEAHLHKAKSLTSIMSKAKKTKYRIGTTGTLDNSQTHRLVIEGLFGPTYHTITTKKLIDQDLLSQISIDCIQLQYSQQDIEVTKRMEYADEIRWVVGNAKRNNFIKTMCSKLTGNTLVLFNFVELQGKPLYEAIKSDPQKSTYFIHGATEVDEREDIRKIMDKESNSILIASYGTCSTGINIRNIHNIIFASPSKSIIRVLQSIGRGLRKSETKTKMNLFDIADDLKYKKYINHGMRHLHERLKIYTNEGFPYRLLSVGLSKETNENIQNSKT